MRLSEFRGVVIHLAGAIAIVISLPVCARCAAREIDGLASGPVNPLTLWYPKPAKEWTEALAIGNGRLGAMVFGQPDNDRIQLNEITVWSGGPAPNADNPDGYKALPD